MPSPLMPDAIILCGGAGLRLRSVTGEAPKSMADVAGRPFLELLLHQLQRYGFQRAILAVGYQKNVIISSVGKHTFGIDVAFAVEDSPLGTGGAVRNAITLTQSDPVLVSNGDSYTGVDLSAFAKAHARTKADLSVVVVPSNARLDVGSVLVDQDDRLRRFAEKQPGTDSNYHINAGIYAMSRHLLSGIPPGVQISLERELFPQWIEEGKEVRAFHHQGPCIDIGTPDRYHVAQQMLANVEVDSKLPAFVEGA